MIHTMHRTSSLITGMREATAGRRSGAAYVDMIYGVSHGRNMLRWLLLEESWIPLSSISPLPPNDLVACSRQRRFADI